MADGAVTIDSVNEQNDISEVEYELVTKDSGQASKGGRGGKRGEKRGGRGGKKQQQEEAKDGAATEQAEESKQEQN